MSKVLRTKIIALLLITISNIVNATIYWNDGVMLQMEMDKLNRVVTLNSMKGIIHETNTKKLYS